MEDVTARRIAENNARFREANERIAEVAVEYGLVDRPVPFVCECSDESCAQLLRLLLGDYRYVRSNVRWFLHAPGHESEVPGIVRLVEERDGYAIVEKVGQAGDLASELAPGEPSG
jgi:hypothetical protein